jgi:uncharacterized protein YodC (DUF2158 family)
MSTEFAAGDVVKLKSGGPKMTVTNKDNEKVWVTWFADAIGDPKHSTFPKASVDKV